MGTSGTFDRVVDALAHRYRRRLLVALCEHNPQDATDTQGAEEALGAVEDVGDVDPELIETELVHNHLPKLEEFGFIRWNDETGEISRGPNWDDIEPLLRLLRDHEEELPDGWL